MKVPKISVIIPAYNEEKAIGPCLQSIYKQDLPADDYEVIVVDNNSTDKTSQIVRQKFPRTRLVKEKKQGVVFARITGIKKAKSEIIAFTDADGIVKPYWLKNLLKAYKDPAVVAVGGIYNLEPKNRLVKLIEPVLNTLNPALKIMSGCNLSFRKEAYEKIGGFPSRINFSEDYYLSLKIKKAGKVLMLKDSAVSTSSRRYSSKEFFPYAAKFLLNVTSIALFDKSLFFNFKPVRETLSSLRNKPESLIS